MVMGAMYTAALAEAVEAGDVSLGLAVSCHLTSNCYPPVKGPVHDIAIRCVERFIEDPDLDIDHEPADPLLTHSDDTLVTISEVLDAFHLWGFVS